MSSSASRSSKAASAPTDAEGRPGYKQTSVMGTKFEMQSCYKISRAIGSGAYGVVVSALNSTTGRKVAIKKIPNWTADLTDAKRILREVKLMRHFDHENILSLQDVQAPRSLAEFNDVYIVTPRMESDLHRIIYSRQKLTNEHIQWFVYQILCALKCMHSANVIHRDLKPSNILVNSDCALKLCDLGLARGISEDSPELTEYVVTRWYRAPEIMLSTQHYSKAIDVWAVGCILAELLGTKPLFAGSDYIEQIRCIVDIVGSPDEEDLQFVRGERARAFMQRLKGRPKVPWRNLYPSANSSALDLLEKLLQFNPGKRITVEEALAHPYFASLHDEAEEPVCDKEFDFSYEQDDTCVEEVKALLLEIVAEYHDEAKPMVAEAMEVAKNVAASVRAAATSDSAPKK